MEVLEESNKRLKERRNKIGNDGFTICRSGSSSEVCMTSRESGKRFGGQASKSTRWMPWHQEAMKDVVKLR
jgi:hypothetical protein